MLSARSSGGVVVITYHSVRRGVKDFVLCVLICVCFFICLCVRAFVYQLNSVLYPLNGVLAAVNYYTLVFFVLFLFLSTSYSSTWNMVYSVLRNRRVVPAWHIYSLPG